jgi:ribosomal protein S18 acetylase RimI-like enzyme
MIDEVVILKRKSVIHSICAYSDKRFCILNSRRQRNRRRAQKQTDGLSASSSTIKDEAWLEHLRRDVYQELFMATFGNWDNARHARQFSECLNRGGISIIEIDGARVGMIQLFDQSDAVEVGEIQIQPSHQKQGIGSRVLKDTIARSHEQRKKVLLSVALKNERAYQLYERLGFQKVANNDTHNLMACDPQS